MASSYIVVTQESGIQVLGPTRVLEVETVGVVTQPTGIYFEFPIDRASWLADHGAQILGPLAAAIEGLFAEGPAVDGSYEQEQRPSGLLVDYMVFVVQYVPPDGRRPPMTADARVPLGALQADADPFAFNLPGNPREIIVAVYDALAATAEQ